MDDAIPRSDRGASAASAAVAEPALPWRELAALFVGSRLLILLTAGLSFAVVNKGSYFSPPTGWRDWFTRWDAWWYLDVAAHGYHFTRAGDATNVVFLPLYPALVRLASLGGLIELRTAGYLVSFACLWLACVWLWRAVAREWRDARTATLAVTFLLFGPVSFFFSSIYSEALFLPLAIGCLAAARRERWWLAGALGALAGATRFIGVILVVPLVWEYFQAVRHSGGEWHPRLRLAPLVACALPAAGLAAYCALMWIQFGDPLLYFRGQEHWGRHFAWFWELFARESFAGQPAFYRWWFAGTVAVAFGLLALGVRLRVPTTYTVFGLAFGFVYISSRFVEGLPRYFSVVFPLYIVLALAVRRWPASGTPLLALTASLQTLSVILFVNGYWFT